MARKNVVVIGAGFGGLTAAASLAQQGMNVTVLEKNSMPGGRARVWQKDGFVFDMGPSWYLMPEVFESFFSKLGKRQSDYYELVRLDPYYRVFFGPQEIVDITSDREHNRRIFEGFEKGGGNRLDSYLEMAKYKYETAMTEFMYVHYSSVLQFMNRRMLTEGIKLNVFSALDAYVKGFFLDRRARQILEYAMVFLGNSPHNAPALYSIMSHVDFNLGVWYPCGGMGVLARAFETVALELGATIHYDRPVTGVLVNRNKVVGVSTAEESYEADVVLANSDYAYTETQLLPSGSQTYPASYWSSRVIAPSMLLAYLGVNKRIGNLAHHNLYFTPNWDTHFKHIFDDPQWPDEPCYYVGCPSRTDSTVAPSDCENVFLLVPIAPGLEDTPEMREKTFTLAIEHLEGLLQESIQDSLVVKRLYSLRDFAQDYNSYRGTALGLAHTLRQSAFYRPAHRSKKVRNLYYTGHYTHPGVGVPMAVISSQVVTDLIRKDIS